MAGKAKRAAAHKKKMADKRAAKAAKRALYASMRGTSKKNKKVFKKGLRIFSPKKHKHLMLVCGNSGCLKCTITTKYSVKFRKEGVKNA